MRLLLLPSAGEVSAKLTERAALNAHTSALPPEP